jgi:hypothetical protein
LLKCYAPTKDLQVARVSTRDSNELGAPIFNSQQIFKASASIFALLKISFLIATNIGAAAADAVPLEAVAVMPENSVGIFVRELETASNFADISPNLIL